MSDDGSKDGMGPPKKPILVRCEHCGKEYMSDKMKYEPRGLEYSLWWCATKRCDGAGFGVDIFPVGK
jgi:hypothetical protein